MRSAERSPTLPFPGGGAGADGTGAGGNGGRWPAPPAFDGTGVELSLRPFQVLTLRFSHPGGDEQ